MTLIVCSLCGASLAISLIALVGCRELAKLAEQSIRTQERLYDETSNMRNRLDSHNLRLATLEDVDAKLRGIFQPPADDDQ